MTDPKPVLNRVEGASNVALSDVDRENFNRALAKIAGEGREEKFPPPTINRSPNKQHLNTKMPLIER